MINNVLYFAHYGKIIFACINFPGWWHDSDLIHYDLTLINSDKVVAMHRAGAWRELGLAWSEQEPTPDSDNRVVFADFNPDNESK